MSIGREKVPTLATLVFLIYANSVQHFTHKFSYGYILFLFEVFLNPKVAVIVRSLGLAEAATPS